MDANSIVLWFSVIVIVLVALWAILMIRAYDKVEKNE